MLASGGGGIRTHGTGNRFTGFRDRPFRPLRHPSGGFALLRMLRSLGLKEPLEDRARFFREYASHRFRAMIQANVLGSSVEASASSRFGVIGSVNNSQDSTLDDGPRAHQTGFERRVQGQAVEPPTSQGFARKGQGDSFRVRCWIFERLSEVETLRNQTIAVDDQGTDRHFPPPRRFLRQT